MTNHKRTTAILAATTTVAFYLILALLIASFYDFNLSCFLHVGEEFGFRKENPEQFPGYATTEYFHPGTVIYKDTYGYDGAYYYILARDVLLLGRDTFPTFRGDKRSFMRYQRILFPLVIHILSWGEPRFFPFVILLVNLCAIGATVFILAKMLHDRDVNGWLSLIFGLNVGLIFAFAFDTPAPLAYLLIIMGLYSYEKKRLLLSTVCFSLSLITWESSILFLGPVILYELMVFLLNWIKHALKRADSSETLLYEPSQWRWQGFVFLSLAVIPFLACQYYFSIRLDAPMFGGSSNVLTFPFGGIIVKISSFTLKKGFVKLLREILIVPFVIFVVACIPLGFLGLKKSRNLYALMLLLQCSFALFTYEDQWSTFVNATRVNAGIFLPLVLSYKSKRPESSKADFGESYYKYFFAASVVFSALAVFRVLYEARCPYFLLK